MLVRSRFSSTTDFLCGMLGITIGWAIARREEFARAMVSSRNRAKLLLVAVAYAAMLLLIFCLPYDRLVTDVEAHQRLLEFISRPPLAAFYRGTELNAASEVLRKLLLFALLGCLLSEVMASTGRNQPSLKKSGVFITCLLGVCLGLLIEMLQLWLLPHIPDVTDILLAASGAGLGAYAANWAAIQKKPH